jgi:hypothetical protein
MVKNMFTYADRKELNDWGVQQWFQKRSEFLSCFVIEGDGGLKDRMAAFYRTENFGEDELETIAANSLSEKEVLRVLRENPDADLPDYDCIYLSAVSRLASQAFLHLMERGVIKQIQLVQEFPPLAQQQFDQLVQEARPSQPSAPARVADLKQFAKDYHVSPSSELRPKNGLVRVAGVPMPLAEFNELLEKASAAGLVRG